MKVGALYRVSFKWMLPMWHQYELDFSKVETVLYLGTYESAHNAWRHQVLADGVLVGVDDDFLRLLKPVVEGGTD